MPNQIGDIHDNFIESYLNTLEAKILNKDKLFIGKMKNGYIFPFWIYIRVKNLV